MDGTTGGAAAAADASLFDDRSREQVAAEAKRDRAQLAGDRLTAQLNAPLSREEQLKSLRRKQLEIQSGLFTPSEEQPPQGRLFDRPPLVIQAGNLGDTQVNQSQPLDAQIAQSESEKAEIEDKSESAQASPSPAASAVQPASVVAQPALTPAKASITPLETRILKSLARFRSLDNVGDDARYDDYVEYQEYSNALASLVQRGLVKRVGDGEGEGFVRTEAGSQALKQQRAEQQPPPNADFAQTDPPADIKQEPSRWLFRGRYFRPMRHSRLNLYPHGFDLAADAQAFYHQPKNGNSGVLYLNRAAAEIVRQFLGGPSFSGKYLAPDLVAYLVKQLRRGSPSPEASRALQALADQLQQAPLNSPLEAVVATDPEGPRRLENITGTRRHEIAHSLQARIAGEDGILGLIDWDDYGSDPIVARAAGAARSLDRKAGSGSMSQQVSFAEVPAYISGGEWKRLGLSFDQAVDAYDRFLQYLEAEHGQESVEQVVRKVHSSIRSALYDRRPYLQRPLQSFNPDSRAASGQGEVSGRAGTKAGGTPPEGRSSLERPSPEAQSRTPNIYPRDLLAELFPDETIPPPPRSRSGQFNEAAPVGQGVETGWQRGTPSRTGQDVPGQSERRLDPSSAPRNDVYLGSGLGALQPGLEAAGEAVGQFTREEVVPQVAALLRGARKTVDSLVNLLDPRRRVPTATLDTIYRMKGGRDAATYLLTRQLDQWGKRVDQMTQGQVVNFIDRLETGHRQVDSELRRRSSVAGSWQSGNGA